MKKNTHSKSIVSLWNVYSCMPVCLGGAAEKVLPAGRQKTEEVRWRVVWRDGNWSQKWGNREERSMSRGISLWNCGLFLLPVHLDLWCVFASNFWCSSLLACSIKILASRRLWSSIKSWCRFPFIYLDLHIHLGCQKEESVNDLDPDNTKFYHSKCCHRQWLERELTC